MPSALTIGRALQARNQSASQAPASTDLNPLAGGFGGMGGYGGWMAGTPGGTALPREIAQYLQGAFGPLNPIPPMPIDVPRDDSGRPEPRRWQYPVGWNLPIGTPGTEGLKVAAFEIMRQYAKYYSVIRACLRVRKDEMLGLDWDILPTKAAEKAMRGDMEAHRDFMGRRAEALRFFQNPDPYQYDGFHDWFSAVLEDLFVTDALAFHLQPPRLAGKGLLGSNLGALELLDGTTIRPLIDMRGGRPRPPNVAYQQYVWGVPRVDLMQVYLPEDAEEMASEVREYRADQLMYRRTVPISNSPYGFSMVEQALMPEAIGISRQAYLLDYYKEGSLPAAYVVPGPDIASATQRRQLQDTLNAIAGDVGYKFKIIVLPPHSEVHDTKEVKLADGSDQVVAEMVMMVFGVDAPEIAMIPGGRTSGIGGAGHAEGASEIRKKQRSGPLAKRLKGLVLDFVLQQICGQQDMEFRFLGLEDEEDEKQKSEVRASDVAAGIISRDEARGQLSLPPWNLPLTATPTVTVMSGPVPLDPQVEGPVDASEPEPDPNNPPASERNVQQEDRQELADDKKPPTGGTKPAPGAKPQSGSAQKPSTRTKPAGDESDAPKPAVKSLSPRHELALRELDELRGFLRHGKQASAFRPRHLPAGELETVAQAAKSLGVSGAIAQARERIRKADQPGLPPDAEKRRREREAALAALLAWTAGGLGSLANQLLTQKLAPLSFVDQGAQLMASSYEDAYQAGANASGNEGGDASAFADDLAADQHGYLQGLAQDLMSGMSTAAISARMGLYASTLIAAYEAGQLAGMLTGSDQGQILTATWYAQPKACGLCAARDGKTFIADASMPLPGDKGFGAQCAGGPNCRCVLVYGTSPATQADPAA